MVVFKIFVAHDFPQVSINTVKFASAYNNLEGKVYSFQILDLQSKIHHVYITYTLNYTTRDFVFSLFAPCCLSYTIMADEVNKYAHSTNPGAITTTDIKSASTGDNLTLFIQIWQLQQKFNAKPTPKIKIDLKQKR